jgi:hypothetical protein
VKFCLHVEELLRLFLGELVDGNTGPQREHLGDGFFVDFVEQVDAGGLDLDFLGGTLVEQLLLGVAETAGFFEALRLDGILLLLLNLGDFVLELFEVGRRLPASSTRSIALSGRCRSAM